MTVHANPIVMSEVAAHRSADLQAQADRDRLAQIGPAQGSIVVSSGRTWLPH